MKKITNCKSAGDMTRASCCKKYLKKLQPGYGSLFLRESVSRLIRPEETVSLRHCTGHEHAALFHANLNILAAENRSVLEELTHAMSAKLGLILFFSDLLNCALRQVL